MNLNITRIKEMTGWFEIKDDKLEMFILSLDREQFEIVRLLSIKTPKKKIKEELNISDSHFSQVWRQAVNDISNKIREYRNFMRIMKSVVHDSVSPIELEFPINRIRMTNRCRNALWKLDVTDLKHIIKYTKKQFERMKGVGPVTTLECLEILSDYGLTFKPE